MFLLFFSEFQHTKRYTIGHPTEFSALSLTKVLTILCHLAKYASTNAANNIYTISPKVAPLVQFNTVLAHQGQPSSNGIFEMWQRVKGGAVDEGLPIRTKAKELMDMLANVKDFREMRKRCASEHSLVPVGDKEQAGFVTDQLRLEILKDKLEKERFMQTQSTLKKTDDGFGSGYNSKKGDTVVGAAHGMEDTRTDLWMVD